MNILILSSNHPYRASGLVALDLYKGLKRIDGNNVKIVVKERDEYENRDVRPDLKRYRVGIVGRERDQCEREDIIAIDTFLQHARKRIMQRSRNALLKLKAIHNATPRTDPDYYVLDYDETIVHYATEKILAKTGFIPDVIVILFMHHFLSYRNLYELNHITGAPIYQMLMDMAPFTAGCHYAWECIRYQKECGNCIAMFSQHFDDQSHLNWKYKKHLIEETDITFIAAAEWQWRQIQNSSLLANKNKIKILAPTDDDLFRPHDKHHARRNLNLPLDKRLILCGTVYPRHRRKGYKELIEALHILYLALSDHEREAVMLVMAGDIIQDLQNDISFDVKFTGYLSHPELAFAYQAADIFLNSSIEDSGPTMINQAIMSGTPVVAFEMGVAPDLVKSGVTGYMAKLKDTADFAHGIQYILSLPQSEYDSMASQCRRLALESCSLSKVANAYQTLFNSMTKK